MKHVRVEVVGVDSMVESVPSLAFHKGDILLQVEQSVLICVRMMENVLRTAIATGWLIVGLSKPTFARLTWGFGSCVEASLVRIFLRALGLLFGLLGFAFSIPVSAFVSALVVMKERDFYAEIIVFLSATWRNQVHVSKHILDLVEDTIH